MRILFAHDHIFKMDEKGQLYSGGSFSEKVFQRYLKICDELVIVGRMEYINSSDSNKYNLISADEIKFIGVDNIKTIKGVIKKGKVQSQINNIVRECDAVIGRTSTLGLMAVKAAEMYQKPYLMEIVGCSFDSYWNYGNLLGKIYAPYSFLKTRRYVKRSRFNIYVTNEFLQNRYPTHGTSIGCSNVILKKTDEQVLKNRLDKIKKSKGAEKLVIGTAAAIDVRYKGQQYVIEALAELAKQGYDFEYQLAGGGNTLYLEKIAEEFGIRNKIMFLGSIPHDKIFGWFDNLDLYIQPSQTEGLPRAVIEAMSRGCPVIVSNVGGMPELIEEKYLFKKSNSKDLATKIRNMITENGEMVEQAKRNFYFSKNYTEEVLEKRRNDFLQTFARFVK